MKIINVAIIIPAYNKSHITNLCIDSILKSKNKCSYEIIVVDNNSIQDERRKLEILCSYINEKTSYKINLISNNINLGFAKAVNQGIKFAFGSNKFTHICLLNNDTIVSDHWLDDLTEYAPNSLVGPVCNSVGNEQIIKKDYTTFGTNGYSVSSVNKFARKWRSNHLGNTESTMMLGFFCVLGEIELFEKVGLLDEAFGLGYYEDDDYCLRVTQSGFVLTIVRQCFVHHWGSESFKDMSSDNLKKLFSENRIRFIDKHKTMPQDQSNAWLLSIIHEYSWGDRCPQKLDSLLQWNNPLKRPPLKIELKQKIIQKIIYRIKPAISYKLLHFLFRALKADNKIDKIKMRMLNFIDTFIGTTLRVPFWSFYLRHSSEKLIFIFPIQGFSERKQRPQHLATELGKSGFKVIWIDPHPNRMPQFGRDICRVAENTFILKIGAIDYSNFYTSSLSLSWAELLQKNLCDIFTATQIKNATAIFETPFWHTIDTTIFRQSIYDCMDAHDAFGSATIEVKAIEAEMFKKVQKTITTSNYLKNRIEAEFNINSKVIRNGCSPSDFLRPKYKIKESDQIVVGYFGAVAEWFDTELLFNVAKQMNNTRFEIIGNTAYSTLTNNETPANIKLLGEKPYSELRSLTECWDIAIIPFKLTELIRATNPVKLYEYYALGLPVVSTEIPEVINCPVKAYTANDPESFANLISKAFKENNQSLIEERREYAKNQTWSHRATELVSEIES